MSDATDQTNTGVFRLIYRSRDLIPSDRRRTEFGDLFSTARSNNKKRHITGALLLHGDYFVQILEGEESAVRALFAHIEKDPRHEDVALLDARTVDERVFSRWSMAKVAIDGEADIPLIAHADGIAAASSRGTTEAQEAVLDIMRQAARGDSAAV